MGHDPALPLDPKREAYCFERSLGIPPTEACRRAGGDPRNGSATKWEQARRVQARIRHLRTLGQTDAMIEAKRQRVEDRLNAAAFGNIFDFASFDDDGKSLSIDWSKVRDSEFGVAISGFRFDRETGKLVDFERDSALQALAQLRDMHGFRAPQRSELTGKDGSPLMPEHSDAQRARALAVFVAKMAQGRKVAAA